VFEDGGRNVGGEDEMCVRRRDDVRLRMEGGMWEERTRCVWGGRRRRLQYTHCMQQQLQPHQ